MAPEPNGSTPKANFIVVGAGYAGLAASIELAKRGYAVEVFESTRDLTNQGDVIQISSYATLLMSNWGNVLEESVKISSIVPSLTYFDWKGKPIIEAPLPQEFGGFPILYSKRGEIQRLMFEHAKSIGVKFRFGVRVTSYFEEGDKAGIYLGAERFEACGVIAADGIHSHARSVVTGKPATAKTSGFAIYRSWFNLDTLRDDPLTRAYAESPRDKFHVWLGHNTHCIVMTNTKLRGAVLFCTHKASSGGQESWTCPGKVSDILEVMDGWDEVLKAVAKHIPEDNLIDWKLLWRDPAKKWVSDNGRIQPRADRSLLVGDAAHPHLPTSGSGAGQAFEDAATIGTLIGKKGIANLPVLFRAYENLRYERTSLTQRLGWETRHRWHQTNWDVVKANPALVKMPQPEWLYGANAIKYTIDNMDAAIDNVEKGSPFISTNVPEGHEHEDWSVESMMELEKQQSQASFYTASVDVR
ncbi:hypothetical protein BGZ61DRAFT_375462 [Ilyonectria robusta]|uniref:uncharacterized protein n=1 Tax=Ilyonectria robusta TaxID=1079257 RepID=UPI001E8DF5B2|nr:uncharacterized protein BGZ61DRAFT_375462 [Ilyonectria robusta]KAH8650770.1 hypothetical protein BGZ61DRAFT_375462 [Ilyonectria robusta]